MRIASLSPATTEILFAMEKQKWIVCVDKFSDYPEGLASIPHLQGHQEIDIDALRQFTPEIVFTSTLVQEKLATKLREEGFGVVHQDPRSIPEIEASIREIGAIVGCDKRAYALVESMQQGFNDVKRKSRLFPRKPRVYIEEWHHPPMVSGNWVPDVVKIAGGIPFAFGTNEQESGIRNQELRADLPTCGYEKNPPSREVSLATIQIFDPDMIVLSICGAGAIANRELLTSRAGWADLRAVKDNHLFVIDDSLLNRPGPRLVVGARRLFGWMFY